MKITKAFAAELGLNYRDFMYDADQSNLSSAVLMGIAKSGKTKEEMIDAYRNYLEACLFGSAFVSATKGINTRESIRSLFAGSDVENELKDLFASWNYSVSKADVWKMMCENLKNKYQYDLDDETNSGNYTETA